MYVLDSDSPERSQSNGGGHFQESNLQERLRKLIFDEEIPAECDMPYIYSFE